MVVECSSCGDELEGRGGGAKLNDKSDGGGDGDVSECDVVMTKGIVIDGVGEV